jgi:transcriptional regulator with XRE-family HTH domain
MPRPSRFQFRGIQHIFDRFVGDDPERIAAYERALSNARAAQAIYDLRTEAGLTQTQLAQRVGTTASVISRLEDADYEGHTLAMLSRVAAALGRRVEMTFPRVDPEPQAALQRTNSKGTRPAGKADSIKVPKQLGAGSKPSKKVKGKAPK